ncbi:MAG: hypothetical protein QNJ51_16275 [Calothrix sp. MO_167.B12]|nr:hypothetical protein [Calothrix sp. MO_167.B12]
MSTGKGKKRVKNVPVLHDEIKKRHGILLTDTAWAALVKKAKEDSVSVSEMIESWARSFECN